MDGRGCYYLKNATLLNLTTTTPKGGAGSSIFRIKYARLFLLKLTLGVNEDMHILGVVATVD